MLLDKFQYLLGDIGVGTDVAAIHLPVAQLFHLGILGWDDASGTLGRLAEVRTIECNGRHRPTPQSLPGFLAQALEEPIFLRQAIEGARLEDYCWTRAKLLILLNAPSQTVQRRTLTRQ